MAFVSHLLLFVLFICVSFLLVLIELPDPIVRVSLLTAITRR